jgi:hypothetical protein
VTRAGFISGLKIEDYKNFLCDKYKTSIKNKQELKAESSVTFSGCELVKSPSLPFTELTVHQYLGSADSLKVTNK